MVDRIRLLCKSVGTNIKNLELLLGFPNGTIRRWDKSTPAIDKVATVASYFGVTMEYLMYGEEKQPAVADGLSEDESMMLCFYRALPDKEKPTALLVFDLFRLLPEAERQNVLQRLRRAAGRN